MAPMPGHVRAARDGRDSVFHGSSGWAGARVHAAAAPMPRASGSQGAGLRQRWGSGRQEPLSAQTHLCLPGLQSTHTSAHSPPAVTPPAASGLPTFPFAPDTPTVPGKYRPLSGLWALAHAVPSTWSPLPCSHLQAGLGHSDPPSGLNGHITASRKPSTTVLIPLWRLLEMPCLARDPWGP